MTPFGQKMRDLRKVKGVSQSQMATDLGVSPAYLSALEHGKRGQPSYPLLQKIIHYFGLIWDDAEQLERLASLSRPRVVIDTSGLDARATEAVNLLSRRIGRMDDDTLDALLKVVKS
ncbi:transcriptional regulator [Kordiimonas sediminis]|uniref:Transcriptional regulator n=1 Tax=Kordiimonas sediminis TaxID=1735581 RepID=A0A919E596_9PROT|nr:helix-turn-helix domain-containing protein [Kordiimonas sediminis]GHF15245.1 transcriptional regulator [Kordiimonas sediminis]